MPVMAAIPDPGGGEVRDTVKLKESYRAWLTQGTPEAADGYWLCSSTGGCGNKSLGLSKVRGGGLRRGKQSSTNTVYGGGGELLTSTEDIVGWQKEYFEDLLNPTDTPSIEEAEAGDSRLIHSSLKPKSLM